MAFGILFGLAACTVFSLAQLNSELSDRKSADLAKSFKVKIDSLKRNDLGTTTAVVRVENISNKRYSMVFVDCAFMDADKTVLETDTALISNLSGGQTGYGEATAWSGDAVKFARCRFNGVL